MKFRVESFGDLRQLYYMAARDPAVSIWWQTFAGLGGSGRQRRPRCGGSIAFAGLRLVQRDGLS